MRQDKPLDAAGFRALLSSLDDTDIERVHYCYQLGSTFVNLSLMEDAIINAMSICDRIKVSTLLGTDSAAWELIRKRDSLQSSTLGNLISILSKHGIPDPDIAYLKWIKAKTRLLHPSVFSPRRVAGRSSTPRSKSAVSSTSLP